MFNEQYKKEMGQIAPSQDLINRTKATMKAELQSPKKPPILNPLPKRPILRRIAAFTTVAAVILFTIFGTNLLNQTNDIFLPENPFIMRVYAMELQLDGTYIRRDVDITQMLGWGSYYDGEVLYIGLGLWFEFEGYNINTVEFSLNEGFFATQYIGNRGQRENVPSSHIVPPDSDTSILVMYGTDFDKIGDSIIFGNAMDQDILLFWASYDMSLDDWYLSDQMIAIDAKITFENGEIHKQELILDFYGTIGMGWIPEGVIPHDHVSLDWFTEAQMEYVMSAAMESFTYLPNAVKELDSEAFFDPIVRSFEFYIGGHTPLGIRPFPLEDEENEVQRFLMGIRDGIGYVVIVEFADAVISTARAYSITLN